MISLESGLRISPKPNTKAATVFDAFIRGVLRKDLPEATGLSNKNVRDVLSHLRRYKHLPPPTQEEKARIQSEIKGGVGLAVRPYAELGWAPREIKIALDMSLYDNKFSVKQIINVLGNSRKLGNLPKLTQEELHDIRLDTLTTNEELKERVREWCGILRIIKCGNFQVPQGRIEWKKVVSRHKLIKEITGWADGEDEKGLFAYRGGKFCYRIVCHDGSMVYDNLALVQRKQEARQRIISQKGLQQVCLYP